MAIYSTFFLCAPSELAGGFPDWLPPLDQPVRRQMFNPFTKKSVEIETREPEFPALAAEAPYQRATTVVPIRGRYEDYLENRLSPFVQSKPHWCAKGLTDIELEPLGDLCEIGPALEVALYSRPQSGSGLKIVHPALVSMISVYQETLVDLLAEKWATRMSAPDFTHSASGRKLSDGWPKEKAKNILERLASLAKKSHGSSAMYLLIEA